LPKHTNLDNLVKHAAQEEREVSARAGDIFDKAFGFTRADEAVAAGIYPYFKPIAEQHGGTVKVDGRETITSGSPKTPAWRGRPWPSSTSTVRAARARAT
jgi:hypothetical protein